MRGIRRRLQKLGKLVPVKPPPTPQQVISAKALPPMSGEDLLVLRRMIRSRQAGQPLSASNERESRVLEAYRSAFVQEAQWAGYRLPVAQSRAGADRPDNRSL